MQIKIEFNKNRGEPDLKFKVDLASIMDTMVAEFVMIYSVKTGKWELVLQYDQNKQIVGPVEFDC